MKKTAQEIHNQQIEGLSNGMTIDEARRIAKVKEQILINETAKRKKPIWPYVIFLIAAAALGLCLLMSCKIVKPEKPEKVMSEVTEYRANPCDLDSVYVIRQAVFDDSNVFNAGERVPVNDQGVIDFEKGTRCFIIINHIRK